jgi:hypothetical protein
MTRRTSRQPKLLSYPQCANPETRCGHAAVLAHGLDNPSGCPLCPQPYDDALASLAVYHSPTNRSGQSDAGFAVPVLSRLNSTSCPTFIPAFTHADQFQQNGRAINEKVRLYASVGSALIVAREAAADPYQAIEAILPWTKFVDSVAEAEQLARPARFDPLALLAAAYPRVRRYAPTLLESFEFQGTMSCRHCSTA